MPQRQNQLQASQWLMGQSPIQRQPRGMLKAITVMEVSGLQLEPQTEMMVKLVNSGLKLSGEHVIGFHNTGQQVYEAHLVKLNFVFSLPPRP